MHTYVAYKGDKEQSFCDNKSYMDTRKHYQNGWDYCFPDERRKYRNNAGGSTTDPLHKVSETQVNKIEIG